MKLQNKSNFLTIALSTSELWYIAQLFGPGWIFGVDDPTETLAEGEVAELETKAFESLSGEGMISHEGGNRIRIDEIVGGMVYSCIHSKDLMVVKDLSSGSKSFYHFLPDWQLEMCQVDGDYELTLFKDRSDLFQHILYSFEVKLDEDSNGSRFSIPAKELEIAAFLFDSGKVDQAITNLESNLIKISSVEDFLKGYLNPDSHIRFDMLMNRDDEERIHTYRNELLRFSDSLYWITHDEPTEEAAEIMNFTPVSPKIAEQRFNLMLPKS